MWHCFAAGLPSLVPGLLLQAASTQHMTTAPSRRSARGAAASRTVLSQNHQLVQDQNYTLQLPAVVAAPPHAGELAPAAAPTQITTSSRRQGHNPTMAESLATLQRLSNPAAPGGPECMMLPDQDLDAGPKGVAGNKMLSSKYR